MRTASRICRCSEPSSSRFYVGNISGGLVDKLAIAVLIARVLQSLVHVAFSQTNAVASIRFAFFFVQIVAFLWLIGIVVTRLA
jgi:hypothetical protein